MKWLKNLLKSGDNTSEEMVKVYDPTTKTITEVPVTNLTPNLVQARLEGSEDVYWIDAGELHMGERQHESFPEEVRDLIREIKSRLDEVYPMSFEEWEDGFLRDMNPEPEIALWLHVSGIYEEVTSGRNLNLEKKQEYFRILGVCMNSPQDKVLQLADPQLIAIAEAEKVILKFYGGTD